MMSLLFNTLFRFVIAFLPRSKHLLISWLQSPSAVILESKKTKSVTVSLNLLKLKSIELMMPSNHLILCRALLLMPSIFPKSGSFPMSRLFASGGQSIGASESASVLPVNIQDWFPLGLTGLISLQSKGLSRVFSNTTVWKHQFFGTQTFLCSNSHICTWLLEKPVSLIIWTLVSQVMSLLFNTLFRFVIVFLPRSKCLLVSWLQPPSTVILEP